MKFYEPYNFMRHSERMRRISGKLFYTRFFALLRMTCFFLFFSTSTFAACSSVGHRTRPTSGSTTTLYMAVLKNTDCISEGQSIIIEKREILQKPKHGVSGINEGRMIYMPNKDFVGRDHVITRIYYKDQFNKLVNSVVHLRYTVE